MVVCIKQMPQKSMGARRGNQGNHIYPRITVNMGILERLNYFASSETSQALLRRPWNCRAIWHSHMILRIKHIPPEKYRRKTWKSGKSYLERGSLWKRTFSKDCTTLHRQKSRKPFKDAHETLHPMAHAHGSLYQAYAPEKYRRKTWKSGKSHLERGSLWKWAFSRDCTTLHRQKSRKPF